MNHDKGILVTGYKAHELGIFDSKHIGIKYIKKVIEKKLVNLIEEGLEWVLISGQLGVELWAAEVVLALKKQYPDLKLAVITPYLNQQSNWNEANKMLYDEITQSANYVDSISKRDYESPSQLKQKNEFLVNKSDGLLLIYDEEKPVSPTYYLANAKKKQESSSYEIVYIYPDEIEMAYQDDQQFW